MFISFTSLPEGEYDYGMGHIDQNMDNQNSTLSQVGVILIQIWTQISLLIEIGSPL